MSHKGVYISVYSTVYNTVYRIGIEPHPHEHQLSEHSISIDAQLARYPKHFRFVSRGLFHLDPLAGHQIPYRFAMARMAAS
jgi:hypothetical protein